MLDSRCTTQGAALCVPQVVIDAQRKSRAIHVVTVPELWYNLKRGTITPAGAPAHSLNCVVRLLGLHIRNGFTESEGGGILFRPTALLEGSANELPCYRKLGCEYKACRTVKECFWCLPKVMCTCVAACFFRGAECCTPGEGWGYAPVDATMRMLATKLVVERSLIADNEAGGSGGGLYVDSGDAHVEVRGSHFHRNRAGTRFTGEDLAQVGSGGGLGISDGVTAYVVGTNFSENRCAPTLWPPRSLHDMLMHNMHMDMDM